MLSELQPAVITIHSSYRCSRLTGAKWGICTAELHLVSAAGLTEVFVSVYFTSRPPIEEDEVERTQYGYGGSEDDDVGFVGVPYPQADCDEGDLGSVIQFTQLGGLDNSTDIG